MVESNRVRVLLSKIGLDTHDRGIKLVAAWLRDAGMEVIYLDPYRTPEEVARVAVQEDVDVVGTSFLDGGQVGWTTELVGNLRELGAAQIPVVVGGVMPADDVLALEQLGVFAVILPGTPFADVVDTFVRAAVEQT